MGIIKGVEDNKFAPEQSITRAEFTAMAMRFTKSDMSGENIFNDAAQGDWYYNYVVGSVQYGWITGYPDGNFRPNNTINRGEVTAIVNRMLARSADKAYIGEHQDSLTQFVDLAESNWAYYDVTEAAYAHDYSKTNGTETRK